MKLSFWDILASMVMLGGLALATIFINIFINPYSFINPFPPPTPVASLQVPTLTPSQRSLPELWTATPETPGVPSVTRVNETVTITVTGTRLVLPTGTATSTRTKTPTPSKSITNTPNRTLTSIAYKTPTKTSESGSDDTTSPTTPGHPLCSSPCLTSDNTPSWYWTVSTDSGGSGLKGYQITWGTDSGGNNPIYETTTNSWTAPTLTTSAWHYIYVRAVDNNNNQSPWTTANSFSYLGAAAPSVTVLAASPIGTTTATLNGTVNANSSSTTVVFQYGTTTAYGLTGTAAQSPVTGSSAYAVSYAASGLTQNTLYHFRIRADNAYGTTYSGDATFTTLTNPSTTTINTDAPDPSDRNAAYTVSVTVAGTGTPTGTVSVSDGTGATCSITLAGGTGSCSLTSTTAGTKTITASYSGDGSNAVSTDTESHVVNKTNPTITTWPTASTITYGQTLASSVLSGGASTPAGTFAFTTPATAPGAGTAAQGVTFTPTDTTNYNTATGTVNVTVNKANPSITTPPSATAITYGQTLASSTLSGGAASTPGTFAWTTPATTPPTGTSSQGVTFTPTDTTNYEQTTGSASVTVNKADATITWPSASAITYGAALSTSTLSGGSATPTGTFAWTAPATVPDVPGGSFEMTFTPDDAVNYNTETNNISITVNQATTTVTSWPTATVVTGQPLSTAVLSGGAASVSGTFSFDDPSIVPPSGSNSYSATFTPDSGNYTTVSGSITVTASP